jgi:CelD/BcsL family acetyltransferase involved in cellulose biosynthesis
MDIRTPAFAGMLTALWAGDQLVAATMGIRSRSVLHGWVIAYAPEFRKYSPGLMLILKLAQQCESLGIERIDMGRGDEFFKASFASGFTEVHDGRIDADPLNIWLHNMKVHVRESLRNSWLGRPLKTIVERARFATSRTA